MAWATISPYRHGFHEFIAAYEASGLEEIHASTLPFVPPTPGLVPDVGAATGRDAAWLANHEWEVIQARQYGIVVFNGN